MTSTTRPCAARMRSVAKSASTKASARVSCCRISRRLDSWASKRRTDSSAGGVAPSLADVASSSAKMRCVVALRSRRSCSTSVCSGCENGLRSSSCCRRPATSRSCSCARGWRCRMYSKVTSRRSLSARAISAVWRRCRWASSTSALAHQIIAAIRPMVASAVVVAIRPLVPIFMASAPPLRDRAAPRAARRGTGAAGSWAARAARHSRAPWPSAPRPPA